MPSLNVINQENKKVGTLELSDSVFASKVNIPLIHQVIKAQLASARQGTAKTKTKGEVRGGGRKPFRQKGTGNARQGSIRTPLRPGGGQTFGPQPRDYDQRTPKKMIQGALRSALSDRVKSERLLVIDSLDLKDAKTKKAHEIFRKNMKLGKVLIVDDANENLLRAARNLPLVKVLRTDGVNVYDIIKYEWMLVSKRAAQALDKRLAVVD